MTDPEFRDATRAQGVPSELSRALLERLAAPFYTCDAQGQITFYNQAAVELWGQEPDTDRQRWCGSHRLYLLDGRPFPIEQCFMAVVVREGRTVPAHELILERPDGSRRRILPHPEPIHDPVTRRVVGASNLILDVTDLRRAERDQALLAAIVESSDDAIISKTLSSVITSWNHGAQRMFGYTADEAIGQSILMLIPQELHPEEQQILTRLRRGERVDHYETIRLHKSGRPINISLSVSPLYDHTGAVVGASKVARDVTEQVAARRVLEDHRAALEEAVRLRTRELEESHERLRQSERMALLGSLSAGLGHDMGNLLVPLRVRIEALAHAGLPDHLRADVEAVKTAAEYLQRLASGLRLMALDPDRTPSEEIVDVQSWWSEVAPMMASVVFKGFELHADFEEACRVRMSHAALTQTIFNLVQNAGEALRACRRGAVRVSARRENGVVAIRVSDDGPGMTPEVRERCLEPFFTTKPRGISTGLGLALVSGQVRAARGSLEVEAEPGRGATFTIRLPDASHEALAPDRPHMHARIELRDPRLRAYVASEAAALGISVAARDGADADRPVDLLITDALDPREPPRAPRTILFSDADAHPAEIITVPSRPRPDAIRAALRAAREHQATP